MIKEYNFYNYREFTKPNWSLGAVYYIKNIDNGKLYIGSSKQVGDRINEHVKDLKSGAHCNTYLLNSFNAHGIDKFVFGVFTYEPDEIKLRNLELEYSLKHKVYESEYGYNLRLDGYEDHVLSEEGRKRVQKRNYELFRVKIVRIDCNKPNIKIYDSLKSAREEHKSAVGSVLVGRTYFSKGGYTWLRYSDFEKIKSIS